MYVESAEQAWELLESGDAYLITPREIAVQATVLGAVVGGVVGFLAYRHGQKVMSAKYEEILADEISEAKAFYSRLNKEGMDTPEKAVEALHPESKDDGVEVAARAIRKYQGVVEEDEEELGEEIERSMREPVEEEVTVLLQEHPEADDGWSYEDELEIRLELAGDPYVIHLDEFMENEDNFDQTTLTWYAGDQTLADEQEKPIPYPDPIVNEDNLKRFGDGSGDPRVVFVRNERLSMDYEIQFAEGKYAHEVLGLEHSDGGPRAAQRRKALRKFRDDPR